jgi:hypothetical protein
VLLGGPTGAAHEERLGALLPRAFRLAGRTEGTT